MTIFGALGIAGSGLTVHRKWLDAVSDNLANVNDATSTSQSAFQARYVVAQEMGGEGGVAVAGTQLSGDTTGRVVYEPGNPLADAQGNVRYPEIDTASQMTQLIIAQRGYQANAAVIERATEAYQAALQIGK
ncbi:MAG: flagellar basal-body rod protein FlgC [Cellulomonas sp. 73-145]|jgi:flagellar basal-body rod protein FlgC|uniref:flagellar basal body rod protein FlgC n=1 Tax=Cellulomonas sp. 73-145 TaxID=1895739 RepID=UPI0009267E3F|nr:flagellar basal body rod C-terminal domain-containing protein [Cellulomonas sp. 73-145]MBN9326582.1 flagellar basal-body rod protein FlgC [Cellulomonas sp.]OJV60016.1 MAG: flagellar basal-body rod protein FlgC [Cellulomonas sp. 73-145]OZB50604.1 MAG: flagellar basal-body rod protein FlgC [Cellulomonas sp. 14-74-6]